MLFTFDKNTW